jgi:hypothetical protein
MEWLFELFLLAGQVTKVRLAEASFVLACLFLGLHRLGKNAAAGATCLRLIRLEA